MPGLFGVLSSVPSAQSEFLDAKKRLIRRSWITAEQADTPLGPIGMIGLPGQMKRMPVSSDGGYHTALFGYLSNGPELAKKYGLGEQTPHSRIAIECYRNEGARGFDLLDGCFNLALYDGPSKRFFLVNDRFGLLPIYYYWDEREKRFAFSPELKGFLASPWVPKEACWEAISDYFVFGQPWGSKTFLNGVMGIDPGCYVEVSSEKLQTHRYWSLSYNKPNRSDNSCSALSDELDRVLDNSFIGMRNIGGKRGLFISGGYDSRMIACYMHRAFGPTFDALGMQYEGKPALDSIVSTRIAKSLGVPWKAIDYSLKDKAVQYFHEHLDIHDGTWPCSYLPNALPNDELKERYDIIVNGNNGNHLFGDYATVFLMDASNAINQKVDYDFFFQHGGDGLYRLLIFRLMSGTMNYTTPVCNASFNNEMLTMAAKSFDKEFYARPDIVGAEKYEYLAITQTGRRYGVFNIPLMDYYEQINPFYDRRDLIEFMASVPLAAKFSRLYDAENMRKRFPEVNRHPKISGYKSILHYAEQVVPQGKAVDDYYDGKEVFATSLSSTIDEIVNDRKFQSREWLNPEAFNAKWKAHKEGSADNTAVVASLLAVDYFFRKFVD